jgi:hypothetical protein
VPHISLVFREMWDTTILALKPVEDFTTPSETFAVWGNPYSVVKPSTGLRARPAVSQPLVR